MLEPSLLFLVFATLVATIGYLAMAGRRLDIHGKKGWRLTLAGFGLVVIGVTIRAVTALPGDIPGPLSIDRDIALIVEIMICYAGGCACIAIGIRHWLPALVAAGKTEQTHRKLFTERKLLFDMAPLGVLLIANRKAIQANKFMEDLFGWSESELRNIRMDERVGYPTQEALEQCGKEAYEALGRGETYKVERQMMRKDGSLFWCHMQGVALDPEAPHDGSVWIFQDVGQRKSVEENLIKAQSIAKIGHFEYFPQTDENIWSDGMYEIFGLPLESVSATPDFLVDFMPEETVEDFRQLLTSDKTSFGAEVSIESPGG